MTDNKQLMDKPVAAINAERAFMEGFNAEARRLVNSEFVAKVLDKSLTDLKLEAQHRGNT